MESKQRNSPQPKPPRKVRPQTPVDFPCEFCGKVFVNRTRLSSHMKSHTREKPYKCPECDKVFPYQASLQFHINAAHRKIKYTCTFPNCGKQLGSAGSLRVHQSILHDPESVQNSLVTCPICEEKVKKVCLAGHVSRHTIKKNHICEKCDKKFCTPYELRNHVSTHLLPDKRKVFPCSLCNYKAKQMSHLTVHIKVQHSINPRPFACTFCDKKFGYRSGLNNHLRMHTGETPFPCTHCEKSFKNKSTLSMHITSNHSTNPRIQYNCTFCDKKFNQG